MNTYMARGLFLALVACLALVVGGCSQSEDKKSKRKGGSSVAYPPVPTELPALTGMPVAFDSSGGTSTGNAGGPGGAIRVRASSGRLLTDDGRTRPPINNNFLTPTALSGNVVTYSELIAINPSRANQFVSSMIIDLIGEDFYLPAGATLDLSDAPAGIGEVAIRTNLAGDFIRIDGNVNGVRLTQDSVALTLLSELATAVAISIDGNIDLRGYASPVTYNGGNFNAVAYRGGVIVTGTVRTFGNSPGAQAGGEGGAILIASDLGDIILPPGIFQANGGDGTTGGDGGQGQFVASSATEVRFAWGWRANGGSSTGSNDGANGGQIAVTNYGPLDLFFASETHGGASQSGAGGNGGSVSLNGFTSRGATALAGNGGSGDEGGDGANMAVSGDSVFGLLMEGTANGGAGESQGGRGGNLQLYCDGEIIVNVSTNLSSRGGHASDGTGGNGGSIVLLSYGEVRNLTFVADNTGGGGSGTSGTGGDGGSNSIMLFQGFGEVTSNAVFSLTSYGGNGADVGGDAGGVSVNISGTDRNDMDVSLFAVGGIGTASGGGRGGFVSLTLNAYTYLSLELSALISGGDTVNGNLAGAGGEMVVGGGVQSRLELSGLVSARGGTSQGSGGGGMGGTADLTLSSFSSLVTTATAFDLRGGNSQQGRGGNAAGGSFTALIVGQTEFGVGLIDARGGDGSTLMGASGGGNGGVVSITSILGRMQMGSNIYVSGGAGAAAGSGGSAGEIEISAGAMEVTISGILLANGADADAPGQAGEIRVTGSSSTRLLISGILEANGGNSSASATPSGASGGIIEIGEGTEVSVRFTATARVRANGGTPTSAAGTIDIDIEGTGTSQVIEDVGSLLETLDGAGNPQPNIDRNTN